MTISDRGLRFIAQKTGFSNKIYSFNGEYFIGFATKLSEVDLPHYKNKIITETEAIELLKKELEPICDIISMCPTQLSQNQFDALCSFICDVGCDAYLKSPILRYLHQSDFKNVIQCIQNWKNKTKHRPSQNRRIDEVSLFVSKN